MTRAMMSVRRLTAEDIEAWVGMRCVLFPDEDPRIHPGEITALLADPRQAAFVASEEPSLIGFIEVNERSYAEGCETSPVAFIEALWVDDRFRRRGVATKLVDAAKAWATARGHRELGSDTQWDNVVSQAVHRRLGFEEADRIVCYRMALND